MASEVRTFDGNSALEEIMNDPKLRKLAAAMCADGGIDDVANVTELINGHLGKDQEYDVNLLSKLYGDYELATSEKGYFASYGKNSTERKAWECEWYGKEVGGFHSGEAYADRELKNCLEKTFPSSKVNVVNKLEDLRCKLAQYELRYQEDLAEIMPDPNLVSVEKQREMLSYWYNENIQQIRLEILRLAT